MRRALLPLVILLCAVPAVADVPTSMSIQGRITDSTGGSIGERFMKFTFQIFDAQNGGALIWLGELQNLYVDSSGLWNAQIGALNPLTEAVFADTSRWLEISVGDSANLPETLPRMKLTTNPFSYRVATLDGAGGGSISGNVSIGGHLGVDSNLYISGDLVGDGDLRMQGKATIGPGHISNGGDGFVAGRDNAAYATGSTISGGQDNTSSGGYSTVGGGWNNHAVEFAAIVGGGYGSTASGTHSAVGGGRENTASGHAATIPGGELNVSGGNYAFAAGRRAEANHAGAFVWADSTDADFASTGGNQFLVRASGGVGINTNAPSAALHVGGTPGVDGIKFPDGTLQTTAASPSPPTENLYRQTLTYSTTGTITNNGPDVFITGIYKQAAVASATTISMDAATMLVMGPNAETAWHSGGGAPILWSSGSNLSFTTPGITLTVMVTGFRK